MTVERRSEDVLVKSAVSPFLAGRT